MRAVACWVLLAACGGGDGLSGGENYVGVYQVTLHQRNIPDTETAPCTDFGEDVVGEEMYIRLVEDEVDDPDYLVMQECDDYPSVCDAGFNAFEAHGDHLLYETWGVSDCTLRAWRHTGVLTGTTIRIEVLEWIGSSDGCAPDDAEALLGTPDCYTTEAWEATRL